jgi:hypothetical protein
MESKLQNLLEANNSDNRRRIVFIISQTLLYGHSCHFSHLFCADY